MSDITTRKEDAEALTKYFSFDGDKTLEEDITVYTVNMNVCFETKDDAERFEKWFFEVFSDNPDHYMSGYSSETVKEVI